MLVYDTVYGTVEPMCCIVNGETTETPRHHPLDIIKEYLKVAEAIHHGDRDTYVLTSIHICGI